MRCRERWILMKCSKPEGFKLSRGRPCPRTLKSCFKLLKMGLIVLDHKTNKNNVYKLLTPKESA